MNKNRQELFVDLVSNSQNSVMDLKLYSKFEALPEALKAKVAEYVDLLLKESNIKIEKKVPEFGCLKGKIRMSPDFDDPIEFF